MTNPKTSNCPLKTSKATPKKRPSRAIEEAPRKKVHSPCQPLAKLAAAPADGPELPELDDLPQLDPRVREHVIERIEAGLREGLFAMSAEAYSGMMCCLFPDEFNVPPCPPIPTQTLPATKDRVLAYAARVRAEVRIFHEADLQTDDRHGLEMNWSIGRTPRVKGLRKESATRRK